MAIRAAAILVGLVLFGAGIGALFLADLGVGPWDVLHDALAGLTGRQPGTVIITLGIVLLGLVAMLRQPIGPATVANVVIIGATVNIVLAVVEPPDAWPVRGALVVLAPLAVAFGSMLYLGAGLGTGVRDGLMTALVDTGLSIRAARSTRKLGQAGQSHRRPSEQLLAAQVEGHIHSTPVLASGVHAAVLQQLHGRLGVLRCVRTGVGC